MNARKDRVQLAEAIVSAIRDQSVYVEAADYTDSVLVDGSIDFEEAAEHILAAGYTKPRTITTVAELDGLPDDAVILDDMDGPLIKLGDWWHGSTVNLDSYSIIFPATVLYEPTA